ncbi:MAG TPA: squalene/phytoene synthase family protein, partial [bacterium]|nr:squalene/phytoene synthase family protein [bacterium]
MKSSVSKRIQRKFLQAFSIGSKTFYFSALFLPKQYRVEIANLYHFLRQIDDIADMAKGNNPEAIIKIAKSKDLKDFLDRSKIDSHYFEELVSGILSDTDFKPFNEFNDVCTYCYKVAGTVGIMICNIFGVTDKKTYDYAA